MLSCSSLSRRSHRPRSAEKRYGSASAASANTSAACRCCNGRRSPAVSSCSSAYSRRVSSIDEAGLGVEAFTLLDKALVDQRGDAIEDVETEVTGGIANPLGGLKRAAADEDAEPTKEHLLLGREQIVAPGDRRAQGPLALRCVAGAVRQQPQSVIEASQHRLRREHFASRGSELDRQR